MKDERETFWNEHGYCEDCGGSVAYNPALNEISCDTCDNKIEVWA